MIPVMEFIEMGPDPENPKPVLGYQAIDIQKARLELVKPTNMTEYAIEIHQQVTNEEPPEEMANQHEAVVKKFEQYEEADPKLPKFFDDLANGVYQGVIKTPNKEGGAPLTLAWLKENEICDEQRLHDYYENAKFEYECGQYPVAMEMLANFLLVEEHNPANPNQSDMGFQALWGKFAALIVLPEEQYPSKWDLTMEVFGQLKSAIDSREIEKAGGEARMNAKQVLQQRTWLLHWSLFVFWNHVKGRDEIIGAFMSEKYLQTIQINAPWLLRYLTTAVVINQRRRSELGNLLKEVERAHYMYTDPITQFLECLLVDFDFDEAQEMLGECQEVLKADYFLTNYTDDFIKAARHLVFETYCKIHQKIDLKGLAKKLQFKSDEEAESWIVNLIRTADLDAKIDSSSNCVVMGTKYPSVYQQVINKTKDISIRTHQISMGIDRLVAAEASQPKRVTSTGGGYYDD